MDEQQQQQLLQQIAGALSQGTDPQQVVQALMEKGIPQEQATQFVQAGMQQAQQAQQPSMEQFQFAGTVDGQRPDMFGQSDLTKFTGNNSDEFAGGPFTSPIMAATPETSLDANKAVAKHNVAMGAQFEGRNPSEADISNAKKGISPTTTEEVIDPRASYVSYEDQHPSNPEDGVPQGATSNPKQAIGNPNNPYLHKFKDDSLLTLIQGVSQTVGGVGAAVKNIKGKAQLGGDLGGGMDIAGGMGGDMVDMGGMDMGGFDSSGASDMFSGGEDMTKGFDPTGGGDPTIGMEEAQTEGISSASTAPEVEGADSESKNKIKPKQGSPGGESSDQPSIIAGLSKIRDFAEAKKENRRNKKNTAQDRGNTMNRMEASTPANPYGNYTTNAGPAANFDLANQGIIQGYAKYGGDALTKFLPEYQEGGTEDLIADNSIEVYEGSPEYPKYLEYQKQQKAYDANEAKLQRMRDLGYTDYKTQSSDDYYKGEGREFRDQEGGFDSDVQGFNNPKEKIEGNAPSFLDPTRTYDRTHTFTETNRTYVPKIAKPEGNYRVVKSPDQLESEKQAMIQKEGTKIQGYRAGDGVMYGSYYIMPDGTHVASGPTMEDYNAKKQSSRDSAGSTSLKQGGSINGLWKFLGEPDKTSAFPASNSFETGGSYKEGEEVMMTKAEYEQYIQMGGQVEIVEDYS